MVRQHTGSRGSQPGRADRFRCSAGGGGSAEVCIPESTRRRDGATIVSTLGPSRLHPAEESVRTAATRPECSRPFTDCDPRLGCCHRSRIFFAVHRPPVLLPRNRARHAGRPINSRRSARDPTGDMPRLAALGREGAARIRRPLRQRVDVQVLQPRTRPELEHPARGAQVCFASITGKISFASSRMMFECNYDATC